MARPLILAGPILRRVEAGAVSVFLALSRKATVELRLWPGSQLASGPGTVQSGSVLAGTGSAPSRRVGENLHLVVVTASPLGGGFAPGAFFSYDMIVTPHGGAATGLLGEGLLRDEQADARLAGVDKAAPLHRALGFGENRLPGFTTPAATVAGLRIAHASCRRANYAGWDAMAWLDDWLKAGLGDPTDKWPQQLFLTGDQIYADDVSPHMLPMLTGLGQDLIGGTEQFPLTEEVSCAIDGASFPPLRRGAVVRTQARMTTTSSDSHLLGFGEFAAMYLAAWSSRVWAPLGSEQAMFVPLPDVAAASRPFLTQWETCHEGSFATWKAQTKVALDKAKDRANVEIYRDAVPQVARVLANCPTYMIWDDHEVTDDWNLSGRWIGRVYSRPAGRAIIRNGMMAYGLFQAWGNDPAAFAAGNNKDLLDQAEALFVGSGDRPAAATNRMDELLGFPGAADDKRARWHYTVNGPRHRVNVLDTRTLRDTGALGSIAPPKLVGAALDAQLPGGPLTDGRELLVVVSAAPVINPDLYERVFQPLASGLTDVAAQAKMMFADFDPCKALKRSLETTTGAENWDGEAWAGDQVHQEALFGRMASYPQVVILSGDVHFSATLTLDYWKKGAPAPARIVQLTASGARNGWPGNVESQFRRNTVLQDLFAGVLVERLGWSGKAKLALPAGAHIGPGRRARMNRSPALVPVGGWPAGTTIAQHPETGAPEEPDWRWRIRLVPDRRTGGQNGAPADPPKLAADISPTAAFAGYAAVLTRHQALTQQHKPLMRTMMFQSNIGLVAFAAASGKTMLAHRLLSAEAPGSKTYAVNTVHEASLAAASEPPPVLVTD